MGKLVAVIADPPPAGIRVSEDEGSTWSDVRTYPTLTSPWGDNREGHEGSAFYPYDSALLGNRLVSIDIWGFIMWSDDYGLTWTQDHGLVRNDSIDPNWGVYFWPIKIRVGGGKFLATGSSYWLEHTAARNTPAESPLWRHLQPGIGDGTHGLTYGDGVWLIGSHNWGGPIARSLDGGDSWTVITAHPWDAVGESNRIKHAIYHDGFFFASSGGVNTIHRSSNMGDTWQPCAAHGVRLSGSIAMSALKEVVIIYGVVDADPTRSGYQYSLDNGTTWTAVTLLPIEFDKGVGSFIYMADRDEWFVWEDYGGFSDVGETRAFIRLSADPVTGAPGESVSEVGSGPWEATSWCSNVLPAMLYALDSPPPPPPPPPCPPLPSDEACDGGRWWWTERVTQ